MGQTVNLVRMGWCATLIVGLVAFSEVSARISHDVYVDRCKDDSYCKGYCLSTNPETVSARCGNDLASCICTTPDNHGVKVRFVEERNPVPPTQPTTARPVQQSQYQPGQDVQYVNSQAMPNSQYYYNGNHNSIAGGQQQQQQQQQQPSKNQGPPTPVLLECDATEAATTTCHLFCTMEIKAWYGLCNITTRACACFGVPLSAVQTEPIAAIFHSTAPAAPTPPPTKRPSYPAHGQYPQQQYAQQPNNQQYHQYSQQPNQQQYSEQPNQQQWRPVSPQHQTSYPYQSQPSVLHQAQPNNNQLQEHGSVHTAHGQTATSSFTAPPSLDHGVTATAAQVITPSSASSQHNNTDSSSGSNVKVTSAISEEDDSSTSGSSSRKRRSLNDMALEGKVSASQKDLALQGDCSKYKCGVSCKRSNYLAPDCTPKCVEGQCLCECLPKL